METEEGQSGEVEDSTCRERMKETNGGGDGTMNVVDDGIRSGEGGGEATSLNHSCSTLLDGLDEVILIRMRLRIKSSIQTKPMRSVSEE